MFRQKHFVDSFYGGDSKNEGEYKQNPLPAGKSVFFAVRSGTLLQFLHQKNSIRGEEAVPKLTDRYNQSNRTAEANAPIIPEGEKKASPNY
jgi:hypothetical protein